ncbi:hypothetical protein PsYK624_019630 [Phanerochaete sordida]|uniref:Methyltransferase type 11 domain-containing protein n=1 Tax=Phanerochaete sordida TaxID=48140 RepID=A0A9P3L8V5_9APHY|nr:hypothetical protein PsYK624_019630 [Phanerochaete sordida]
MPPKPPDYESKDYWENRFKSETHFEWLGDGGDTIIPELVGYLLCRPPTRNTLPPLCLHIGAGASTLSNDMLRQYRTVYKTFRGPVIYNTDFAEEVVKRGNEVEQAKGPEVVWEHIDLLRWKDMLALKKRVLETKNSKFELVVDKSTADAIACSAEMEYTKETLSSSPEDAHPLIHHELSQSDLDNVSYHPVEILALHLASLVAPGGVWIALSYSANRFEFLEEGHEEEGLMTGLLWMVSRVATFATRPGSAEPGKHVPDVYHYLYVLQRTNEAIAVE